MGRITGRLLTVGWITGMLLPMGAQSLLKSYCVGCHNQKLKNGGVALDSLDPSRVPADAAVWEKVLHKVRRGEMPPPGLPRPDAAAVAKFTSTLEASLDKA